MNLVDFSPSELGLTADFADYETRKPYVCCGWMPLHSDDDDGDPLLRSPDRKFRIMPFEWDAQAVLMCTVDGRLQIHEASNRIGEVLEFRYDRLHGLLPRDLAERLAGRINAHRMRVYRDWLTGARSWVPPKLVWQWVPTQKQVQHITKHFPHRIEVLRTLGYLLEPVLP